MRDEELVQRSARAAFTYQRARFEPLLEHLCGVLRQHTHLPSAAEVIARVGGDLPQFVAHEPRLLNGLLAAVQIDAAALATAADEVLAGDAAVRDALKESLAQFFPTVQVERDRLIGMQTVRARFVLCTRRMYEAHHDDVFEGYRHIETTDPYVVLCTDHEEGLPFGVLAPMRRAHERYRVLVDEGRAKLGHATVQLSKSLVPIDA
jgi:hypothetical protein